MAGISTTPAQPPAPSGLRSKGHMVVENISLSRKATLGAKPREKVGAGVEKVGAAASSSEVVIQTCVEKVGADVEVVGAAESTALAKIDKRIAIIKAEYLGRMAGRPMMPLLAEPCPSSPEVVIETDVEQVDADVEKVGAAGFVKQVVAKIDKRLAVGPLPPKMPPPMHLRRELTPKLGHGIPKHMGSPPEKKVRFQSPEKEVRFQ